MIASIDQRSSRQVEVDAFLPDYLALPENLLGDVSDLPLVHLVAYLGAAVLFHASRNLTDNAGPALAWIDGALVKSESDLGG